MRPIVPAFLVAGILALSTPLLPTAASAAAPGGVAQPPVAAFGHNYSYQLEDPVLGRPLSAFVEYNFTCTAKNYATGLPSGLQMSTTGLITGTPNLPEQTQFCVRLAFTGLDELAQITMTVSTGLVALDATVIPIGTSIATAANSEGNELVTLEALILNIESYCIPTTRYCGL